jgi:outer membrane lipase/esterase
MDADSLDLNIGATYRASEAFIFGVAATLGSNDGDAGFAGELDGSALLFGVFGQYEINGLYGRLGFSIGSNDMDIDRRIDQLSSTRTETGSTSISQQVGTLEIGYVFKGDNFTHGPYAGVELINNEVDGYTEEGTSATAMRFDEFSRDSNITSIGYQFSGKFDSFQPFARIAYVNETNSDQTFVRAGTASMPGNFSMGGFTPGDSSFIDWNLGVSMTFADSFDGYLSYRGRNGNEVTDNGTFSLGLRKTF